MSARGQDTPARARGWFGRPLLSLAIALCWLLLQGSLELAHLLAALAIGLVVPRLVAPFLGPHTHLRGARTALRLVLIVLYDIVVANLTVAWIVLNPRSQPQPAWVPVPLQLTHPTGIVLLATIITTTPGTISCVIDEARSEILVHALDCDDTAAMAAEIKRRYEAPLMEIFG
ncbi:Na(+)/H(+) antiporter subunit E [Burkholderiaceae bacterium]|nr:Na(+)/H(+) antiporter subunit E [Burkholderiaceae bacterium]